MGQSASCANCVGAVRQAEESIEVTDKAEAIKSLSSDETTLPRLLGVKEDSGIGKAGKGGEDDKDKQDPAEELLGTEVEATVAADASAGESPTIVEEPAQEPLPSLEAEHAEQTDGAGVVDRAKSQSKQLAKAQRKMERLEARTQALPFLQQNGFSTVKSKKTFFWRTYYPLHVAVKQNEVDVVRLLLKAGSDQTKVNWRGQTPQQLAESLNRRGSHTAVLQVLQAQKPRRRSNKRSSAKAAAAQHPASSSAQLDLTGQSPALFAKSSGAASSSAQ
eukprot:gb/GFBE01004520.1/.p1 GENE.gb/GFBE01004520.1/~~gb/GFBE01004520.1/.p1  ORF type:complete len:276 (+),score=66.74 gb/GFBE01004520.1/:1-828(+)